MFIATMLMAGVMAGSMFTILVCIICAGIVNIIDENDIETCDFLFDVMKVAAGAAGLAFALWLLYTLIYMAVLIISTL